MPAASVIDGKTPQTPQAEGRRRAGALLGETTRYLLVYEVGSMAAVTEADVRQVVEAAGGTLLAWHPAIGTALAASENTGFSPDAVAQVGPCPSTWDHQLVDRWLQQGLLPVGSAVQNMVHDRCHGAVPHLLHGGTTDQGASSDECCVGSTRMWACRAWGRCQAPAWRSRHGCS